MSDTYMSVCVSSCRCDKDLSHTFPCTCHQIWSLSLSMTDRDVANFIVPLVVNESIIPAVQI